MMKSGWIGYLKPETFWEDAAKLQKLGYQGMDSDLTTVPGDECLEDKAKRLRDMGIEPLTVSCSFAPDRMSVSYIKQDMERILKDCKAQDIHRVTVWGGSAITSFLKGYGNNGTYDELMEDIESMNWAIPILAEEGIELAYHNHYQEFTVAHKSVASLDWLVSCTDERLKFDFDAGWATVAGQDPVAVMQRLEGRIAVVHLKDIYDFEACKRMGSITATEDSLGFTALGSGLLDVPRVVAEAERQGIVWGIVEQDHLRYLDTMQALTMGRYTMLETGHFE